MNEAPACHPRSCSLSPADLESQLAWIGQLNARALITRRRSDLELVLEYKSLAERDVEKLIEYEQVCCSFLSFELDKSGSNLVLKISAPDSAREAAEPLFAALAAGPEAGRRSACCGSCT